MAWTDIRSDGGKSMPRGPLSSTRSRFHEASKPKPSSSASVSSRIVSHWAHSYALSPLPKRASCSSVSRQVSGRKRLLRRLVDVIFIVRAVEEDEAVLLLGRVLDGLRDRDHGLFAVLSQLDVGLRAHLARQVAVRGVAPEDDLREVAERQEEPVGDGNRVL